MVADPKQFSVATLSVGGHLFNLPVTYAVDKYQIPGVPDERVCPDHQEFLKQVALGRQIELVSVSDPERGRTVFVGSILPTHGCGTGLERVLKSCDMEQPVAAEFCAKAFCPGDRPILDHLIDLVRQEPEATLPRPKEEIKAGTRNAFSDLGDNGVYEFAEELSFAPGGIIRR